MTPNILVALCAHFLNVPLDSSSGPNRLIICLEAIVIITFSPNEH